MVAYTIKDTLPSFLSNVTITELKVVEIPAQAAVEDDPETPDVDESQEAVTEVSTSLTGYSFDETTKSFNIPWVDGSGNSLYKNGSQIVLTYTATVTETGIKIDGTVGNVNTVSIQPNKKGADGDEPFDEEYRDEATIFTYAAALQKIDENKKPLAGAIFKVTGLQVNGSDGDYTVTKYDPVTISFDNSSELKCDANGQLVVKGLKQSDGENDIKLTLTEIQAPDGYNKLIDTQEWPVQKTGEEVTKINRKVKYDEEGRIIEDTSESATESLSYNVNLLTVAFQVINEKGTLLPTTGGIGTTIFYILGSILVLGAAVLLIAKKRMNAAK